MKRTFIVKREKKEKSRFSCSLTKKDGFCYQFLSGEEVEWKHVVGALTFLLKKYKVLSTGEYHYDTEFVWAKNTAIDIRYIPSICASKTGIVHKMPFMIDDKEVLEHGFIMPFNLAVKVALSLSMSYGLTYIEPDSEKIEKNFGNSLSEITIVA